MVAGVCSVLCDYCEPVCARARDPRGRRAHGDEVAGGLRGLFGVLSSDVTYRDACMTSTSDLGALGVQMVGILRPAATAVGCGARCGHRSAEAPPRALRSWHAVAAEKVQHPSTTSRSPARAAAAGCLPTPVGARSTPTLQPGTQPAVCVRYAASHARLLQLESAAKHGGGCQSAQSALRRAVLARHEAAACRGRAPQLMRWLAGT